MTTLAELQTTLRQVNQQRDSLQQQILAAELSHRLGVDVVVHPYDLGYWSRVANRGIPSYGREAQDGWFAAEHELNDEETAKTQTT